MSRVVTALVGALAVLSSGGRVGGAEPPAVQDTAERSFILGHTLTTSSDHGTRVAIGYVHALHGAAPEIEPDRAGRMGRAVADAWMEAYGATPRTAAERADILARLPARAAAAGGVSDSGAVGDVFRVTVGEDARLREEVERRFELDRPAADARPGVSAHPVRKPEALFNALRDAAADARLAAALGPLVRPAVRVRPDAPVAEWRQRNPAPARAYQALEIANRLPHLAGRPKDLSPAVRQVAADADKRWRAAVQSLAARGPNVPVGQKVGEVVPVEERAARLKELEHDHATYSEAVRLFRALAPEDRTVQKVAAVAQAGLNAGFAFAAVAAAGASTGGTGLVVVAAVVAAVEFYNVLKSAFGGDGPSDLEQILDAIREVRALIVELRAVLLNQIAELRTQLVEATRVLLARMDEMELAARTRNAELRDLILQSVMGADLVQGQLAAVRDDVYRAVGAGRRDRLRLLEPRRRWADMPFDTFRPTLDELWVMGARVAADDYGPAADLAPNATPEQPAFFPALGRLYARSPDGWDRLNVTRDAAARLGHPFPGELPPNPKLWALAAHDYAALARKWPDLYQRYDPDRASLRELTAAGRRTQQTARSAARPELLAAALTAYRGQFARSEAAVNDVYLAFAGPDTTLRGYNPFLRADEQKLPAVTLDALTAHPRYRVDAPPINLRPGVPGIVGGFEWGPHNTPDPMVKLDPGKIALPADTAAKLLARVPPEYRYAEELGLGRVDIEYTAAGVGDEVNVMGPDGRQRKAPANVHPGGAVPAEILKNFSSQVTFTHTTRYGRVRLTAQARFTPAQRPEGQADQFAYLIYSHTVVAAPYFSYSWVKNPKATKDDAHWLEFRLVDKDGPGSTSKTLAERFGDLLPEMSAALAKGPPAPEKAVAEKISADVLRVRDLIARHVNPVREEMLKRLHAEAVANTAGLGRAGEAVDGARALLVHLLCLGYGDWLVATPEGRELAKAFRDLPDGRGIAAAVAADPALYANPATRAAAFRLLTTRFTDFEKRLRALAETPHDRGATFGRHLMVEGPLVELEELLAPAPSAAAPPAPEGTDGSDRQPAPPRAPSWWLVWPALFVALALVRIVFRRLRSRLRKA